MLRLYQGLATPYSLLPKPVPVIPLSRKNVPAQNKYLHVPAQNNYVHGRGRPFLSHRVMGRQSGHDDRLQVKNMDVLNMPAQPHPANAGGRQAGVRAQRWRGMVVKIYYTYT